MKNLSFKMLAGLLFFMLIMASCVKPDYTKLPTDVKKIADLKLNNWFANGKVMAANSVDFNNGTNIDFYKWSEQMFLWICLLYTSDAADDSLRVDLGGRRIIKKFS